MRGPSAGQSVVQGPPELPACAFQMGWKAMYLLGLKQKQTPEEVGGWLFLSTIRSNLLLIKSKCLQVLRTFPTPQMEESM